MPPLERRIAKLEQDAKRVTVSRGEEPQFVDDSLPEQAAFIRDPARRKLVFSARRGGKSYGEGRFMLQEAWNTPNVSCLYIGLTRESAWRAMWRDVLKDLNRKLSLGAKFNETKLLMTLPNESNVQLLGLDANEDEKDKLLGGKYKVVVIDEAASFTIDLDDLILKTVGPAVSDHRGTIILSGTPSNVHAGLFFKLTQDQNPMAPGTWQREGWSCHRWCYEQNHYIRTQVELEIGELIAAKGPEVVDTPGFQQMWRGRWCVDDSMLVYKFRAERNTFNGGLPSCRRGTWHYVLGVDTGWKASAFSLCAYHEHDPCLYVLESFKRRALDVTGMAQVVDWFRGRFNIDTFVVDGANKQAVQEMNQRHGLSLVPADKKDKFEFIDIMNDDFAMRRVRVSTAEWEPEYVEQFTDVGRCGAPEYVSNLKCGLLVREYGKLVLDERKLLRLRKREEHPNSENHCADATLYPWRFAYPYLSTVLPPAAAKPGTVEWLLAQQKASEAMNNQLLEEALAERRRERQAEGDIADLIS